MTSRLDCSELGYACDWAITAESTSDVLEAAASHLRDAHRVDSPSDSMRAYLEGFTTTVDEGAHAAPEEGRGRKGVLRTPPAVRRGITRYRTIPMAGRATIVLVAIGVISMLGLLYRTQSTAASIREKTASIAESGRGINEYTDSISQLNRTNELAASLFESAQPLQGKLAAISDSSAAIRDDIKSIKASSSSIADSARPIDASVRQIKTDISTVAGKVKVINARLTRINSNASSILATAKAIKGGISMISSDLNKTARLADQVLADARGINTGLQATDHYAACIDNGLNGGASC